MQDVHFGKQIEKLFNRMGVKPTDFAAFTGKSKQSVYDLYKKDDINTSIIKSICKMLHIEISEFFQQSYAVSQQGRVNVLGSQNSTRYATGNAIVNGDSEAEIIILREKVSSLTEQNKLLREMNDMLKNRDK